MQIIIIIIITIIRAYPNASSDQRAIALIGWFGRAAILCGGKKPKSNSHIVHLSNPGCWTGVLVTLIGHLCGRGPYSFMKEHDVISIEEVSC